MHLFERFDVEHRPRDRRTPLPLRPSIRTAASLRPDRRPPGLTVTPMWNAVAPPIVWPPTSSPWFKRDTALTRPIESTSIDRCRVRVIADGPHIAGDRQQIADAERVSTEQLRLHDDQRLVARRELQHDFDAGLLANQHGQRQARSVAARSHRRARERRPRVERATAAPDRSRTSYRDLAAARPRSARTNRRLAKARLRTDFSDGLSGASPGDSSRRRVTRQRLALDSKAGSDDAPLGLWSAPP